MTAITFVDDAIEIRAPHCAVAAPFSQAAPPAATAIPQPVSQPAVGELFDAQLLALEGRLSGRSRDEVATLERHFWSNGQPALPTAPRERRPVDLDPATMTIDQLAATQSQEIRSISRTVYEETGAGVLSLDWEQEFEDGTGCLAEAIPADSPWYDVLAEVVDADQSTWTQEQHEAYAEFSANFVARRGSTPYVTVDPEVADRIDWERQAAQASQTHTEGVRIANDQVRYFGLFGRRLTPAEFMAKRNAYFASLRERVGRIPSASDFAQKRSVYAALKANGAFAKLAAAGRELAGKVFDEDPDRRSHYDIEAHGNLEDIHEPYIPSFAVALMRAEEEIPPIWQPLPDDAKPLARQLHNIFARSPKDAKQLRRIAVAQRASAIQAEYAAEGSYVAWRKRSADALVTGESSQARDARWHAELMYADDREIGTYGLEPHVPLRLVADAE